MWSIQPSGIGEYRVSWRLPSTDDAWPALDRDGNGTIDTGQELFGNLTPQGDPPGGELRNGFLALALFDEPIEGGNADGWIDQNDAVFARLRLWQDRNHNGVSEAAELSALGANGLAALDLEYRDSRYTDAFGKCLSV